MGKILWIEADCIGISLIFCGKNDNVHINMISLKTGKLYQLTHYVTLTTTESSKAKWLWLDTGEIFMVIEKIYYNGKVNWVKVLTSNGLTGTINLFDDFGNPRTFTFIPVKSKTCKY